MKPEDLADFVTKLCPAVGGRVRSMIFEFRPFYAEVETETLLELEEIPEPPEPHRSQMFGGVKAAEKAVKKEKSRRNDLVSKRRQIIFGNILKLARKS